MKHPQEFVWRYWLPLMGMLALITMESTEMMSGTHTARCLQNLCLWLGLHLVDSHLNLLNLIARKTGHALGYGLLCLLWLQLFRGWYWLRHDYHMDSHGRLRVHRIWWRPEWGVLAVLCTFAVAAADELHQMTLPGRSGSWSDVALDTTAAVLVAMLVWMRAEYVTRAGRESLA